MGEGVATRPIGHFDAYDYQLRPFVHRSGAVMRPDYELAKGLVQDGGKSRIVFAEGEDERVLRAVPVVVDEKLAKPILVGRPSVLEQPIQRYGLRLRLGVDVEVTNPEHDERFNRSWSAYWALMCRSGVTKAVARGRK